MRYVIDTNVAIVANRTEHDVCEDCQLSAVRFLLKAVKSGRIFLDSDGEIQSEYRTYLKPKGQPGVGDLFYREVLNSHPDRISRIEVKLRPDGEYENIPQPILDSGFDPSDRKFISVAIAANASVYNAVDTDWVEKRAVIESNGVSVEFLCGDDPNTWRKNNE